VDKPGVGFALKANIAEDNTARSILFTPNFPPYNGVPDKHKLSAEELFKACDHNKDGRVDYVEYASCIYQSYKHLPDKFHKKFDSNGDDTLDLKEFTASLDALEWWSLSRKTPKEWLIFADKNKSGQLEKDEAKEVIGSAHGKFDQVFGKLDRDKSGGISELELEKFLTEAITGKKSTKKGS
jgi:Ca2+-binding EF-hand superfamily protein